MARKSNAAKGGKSAKSKKTAADKAVEVTGAATLELDHDQIAERAYQIYVSEGCPEGRSEAHWEMAVKELTVATRPVVPASRKRKKK